MNEDLAHSDHTSEPPPHPQLQDAQVPPMSAEKPPPGPLCSWEGYDIDVLLRLEE
jgi:hypothetical protein